MRLLQISRYASSNLQVICLVLLLLSGSCSEFLDIPAPDTQLVRENVFEENETAISAMTGIYNKLSRDYSFADGDERSITVYQGLYSDELASFIPINSSSPNVQFYLNSVTSDNGNVSSTWRQCYNIIYECNSVLEGLAQSSNITTLIKNQLSGEALFIRAFSHFYLVNLFGDIPIVTTSNYQFNASVARSSTSDVYESIVSDLVASKDLLSDEYPSAGRVRINKGAATAMLARVYLFIGDYTSAEGQATEVINNTSQYKLASNLNSVFLNTSEEAIWQLLPRGGSQNYTNEASLFILVGPPTRFALRTELVESFEAGDLRKTQWIDSLTSASGLTKWFYPHKYKERQVNATGVEYSMVLRLAEQYLIRAEARVYQGRLTGENGAQADLDTIRARAGLANSQAVTKDQFFAAIEHERRAEFFTEWGHRFFDLKRTGRLDDILKQLKPNWKTCNSQLPLPKSELLVNDNLNPQNQCY